MMVPVDRGRRKPFSSGPPPSARPPASLRDSDRTPFQIFLGDAAAPFSRSRDDAMTLLSVVASSLCRVFALSRSREDRPSWRYRDIAERQTTSVAASSRYRDDAMTDEGSYVAGFLSVPAIQDLNRPSDGFVRSRSSAPRYRDIAISKRPTQGRILAITPLRDNARRRYRVLSLSRHRFLALSRYREYVRWTGSLAPLARVRIP
jgi:hypothetical protein